MFMACPSHWPSRGVLYDGALQQEALIALRRDRVEFRHDTLLCVTSFGIQNNSSRSRFEEWVPASVDR